MVERDCNDCEFLSITEKEQDDLRKLGYDYTPHICNKYNKRVLHFPYQQPFIHPCEECEKGGDAMRDMLVELIQNSVNGCAKHWAEVIADYLLANGVIVPPCKVGDTVYRIVKMGTGIHYKQIGRCGIGHTQGYKIVPCEEKIKRFIRSVTVTKNNLFDICENFGKTVFFTKEEAEKALKGDEGNETD